MKQKNIKSKLKEISSILTKKHIYIFVIPVVVITLIIIIATFTSFFTKSDITNLKTKLFDENKNILHKVNENIEHNNVEMKKYKEINASVPIFMYHFVSEDPGENPYPENVVRPTDLEKELKYLSENGYETINVTDLAHLQIYTKPVILTFDDGFLDFYTNAFPLFKKYNMKASLYIVNNFTTLGGYCNIEQIKEMQDSGLIDIQSHTVSHRKLATLSLDEIKTELIDSKKYIKENIGKDSTVICYPYGSYDKRVLEIVKENYTYGLAMDGGVYYTKTHKNLLEIPRIYANRSMPLDTFINYVKKSKVEVVW
jgi:peptidoglycan/xylan/chitin deacetylase (PgdA/CDA1 family)